MSRLLLIILGIPLLLIVAVAVLLPLLVDEQQIVEFAARTLQEETGANLTVTGETRLSLFPRIGVALSGVAISLPEDNAPSASARKLEISVKLLPLLSRKIEVEGVRLEGLDAQLPMRQADTKEVALPDTNSMTDAQLDAFYAARREAMRQLPDTLAPITLLAAPLALDVNRLDVSDSRISLIDPTGAVTLIELRQFAASGANTEGRPMTVSIVAAVPAAVSGTPAIELRADGTLSLDLAGRHATLAGLGLTVSGATAQPISLEVQGDIDLAQLSSDLALEFGSGDARGTGSLRFAGRESPQITANLSLNRLDPALLILAGPEAAVQAGELEPGTDGDSPLPLGPLRSLSTELTLTVEQVVYQGYVVDELQLEASAIDGIIDLRSMTGRLFGGRLELGATVNARRDAATLTAAGKLSDVRIADLLAASETPAEVSGTASMDWDLTSRGATPNQLLGTLQGPAHLKTADVVLGGISIQKLLCESVAMVNQQSVTSAMPEDSAMQVLAADITFGDGYANLAPLQAGMPGVQMRGNGRLGLLTREFRARFAARLTPELAELDPACRVNERYAKLDWPVNCSGMIGTDPAKWCAVDTASIIKDLAKGEAERKLSKEAGKLLDRLFGK